MNSKIRSLYKSITWRIIAMTIGFIVTLMFTGSIKISLDITIIANIIAIIIFYGHERIWERVEVTN